jgi:small-conductance mechanosensitive channel
MGADGIRPGDLVEINGVTGEVVELGMFQTVLLETAPAPAEVISPGGA